MATNGKVRKRSNLRHAEYYDFQQTQDELYVSSLQGREFKNLVAIIASPQNIKLAYRNIKKNHGSMTPGTDGKNIKDLESIMQPKGGSKTASGWTSALRSPKS